MEEQIKEQKEGMPEEQKITLTVKEAAKLIGISEKSAYNKLIRLPDFPVVKIRQAACDIEGGIHKMAGK